MGLRSTGAQHNKEGGMIQPRPDQAAMADNSTTTTTKPTKGRRRQDAFPTLHFSFCPPSLCLLCPSFLQRRRAGCAARLTSL